MHSPDAAKDMPGHYSMLGAWLRDHQLPVVYSEVAIEISAGLMSDAF